MTEAITIPPRSGVAFTLNAGQRLTVIDPEGTQCSDFVAYAAGDPRHVLSNGRTFDYEETLKLTTGNRLWSNRSQVVARIVDAVVGARRVVRRAIQQFGFARRRSCRHPACSTPPTRKSKTGRAGRASRVRSRRAGG